MHIKAICGEITQRYEIIRILGQGQSGIVYLAKHKQLQVFRAIKTVPRESRFYEFIKNEAKLLKELRHPSIPIIYDFMEQDSNLYLIEEYVEGENLYEYIQHCGRFLEHNIVKLALDLIEPLEYLHSKNIVHLDLSPNNIMLFGDTLRIIDFDNSSYLHEEQKGYGSIGFVSKEQMKGERADVKMDVYAIGAVLYYAAVCEKYEGEIKKLPIGLGDIREVIRKCLGETKEGFNSLSELKSELQKIVKKRVTKRIAIVGAKAGLGVTFLALCLAKEIRKQNKGVCVFEQNSSGDMVELARRTGKNFVNGFMYHKLHILPFLHSYIEEYKINSDVEVLDCKDDTDRAVSLNPDVLILVCSAKLWNTKYNLTAIGHILTVLKYRKKILTVYNAYDKKDKILLPSLVKAEAVISIPILSEMENSKPIADLAKLVLKNVEE